VARSYFSRLVRGGETAPLAPPRPVSNLWKKAQFDAAGTAPDTEPSSVNHRSAMQRGRVAETVPSLNAAESESRPAPHISPAKSPQSPTRTRVSAAQASQTSLSSETPHPAPTTATSGRTRTTRQDMASPVEQAQAPPAVQTWETVAPAVAASTSTPSVSSRREPSAQTAGPTPAPPRVERKPIPGNARLPEAQQDTSTLSPSAAVEPTPLIARPVAERRPMPVFETAHPEDSLDAPRTARALATPPPVPETISPAHRPQARLQPMESATPGFREPSRRARQSSLQEESPPKTNTVQIGKIEVQVLPPPVSSYRQAPPPQPKGRLARGYALWPGW
jgi:hypothetical protein